MLSKSFHIYFTIYTCIKAHSSACKTNIRLHINYISTRKEESISYNSKENQGWKQLKLWDGIIKAFVVVVVQSLSCVQLFATPWTAACQAFPSSFTISLSLLKLLFIELMRLSNHLILCHPLLLPSIFPSIRVFSNESVLCIRWPKYWSFSFNISPSNEYSGLIFFRIDWFDLAVQGTLKSLFQHHSSKASVLHCSGFFVVQLSHLYMTTGKTITLTVQTFVNKVMSLLFNTSLKSFSSRE